ncbi:hypothetical protein, partial [uncultured Alistipes sp.]|uniref:hypothetical protein n=1 Tax=uncultured Alistipes sp. TaxID=538949 RepID=UPI00272C3BF7
MDCVVGEFRYFVCFSSRLALYLRSAWFRQAAARQCPNKFGIALALHFTYAPLGLGRLRLGNAQINLA